MSSNYRKRPYIAKQAIQCNPSNLPKILELFPDAEHFEPYITLRGPDWLRAMSYTDWIVQGENGQIKLYTNEEFNTKYHESSYLLEVVHHHLVTTGRELLAEQFATQMRIK